MQRFSHTITAEWKFDTQGAMLCCDSLLDHTTDSGNDRVSLSNAMEARHYIGTRRAERWYRRGGVADPEHFFGVAKVQSGHYSPYSYTHTVDSLIPTMLGRSTLVLRGQKRDSYITYDAGPVVEGARLKVRSTFECA